MQVYKASVPGKVILTGEHAVVYGILAVAASVDIRSEVTLTITQDCHQININVNNQEEIIPWSDLNEVPEKITIQSIVGALVVKSSVPPGHYTFDISTKLPIGAGLGSSASLCVGISGVLLKSIQITSLEAINNLAYIGETLIHGKASGIDNTVVTYGGFLSYQQGKITQLPPSQFPFKLLLVNSRVPKVTKTMVENVRLNREKTPEIYDRIFASIQSISETLIKSIHDSDPDTMKECLRINHELLRAVNVCGEILASIVEKALKFKIKGKMTGGGGGGTCVFLVTDEEISGFQQVCEENNWEFIVAELSARGIIIE